MTKRKTLEEIKSIFEQRKLMPIDLENYKDNKTKINFYDEEGYWYYSTLIRVQSGKQFNRFHQDNPHTLLNIKNWVRINDSDYELLSDEYKGSHEKLKWRQISKPELPPFHTSWKMFLDGNRNSVVGYEKRSKNRRKSPEIVRQIIEAKLIEDFPEWALNKEEEYKYKNSGSKLRFTHIEGYKTATAYATLLNDKKSLELFRSSNVEESTHNAYLWTKRNTAFELKQGQIYTDIRSDYVFICPEHGEFESNFITIYEYNTGCWDCIIKAKSGENSWSWNPELSDEDRERTRKIEGYTDWRQKVFQRDWYTCQCCSKKAGDLIAHHLDSYDWCKEKRIDVDNGITLCKNCHTNFHKIFGYGKNTKKQFEDYTQKKISR